MKPVDIPYPLYPTEELLVWRTEDGAIYFVPGRGKYPELLAKADDVAGVWIFNRGTDDPDRDAAIWHDHAYQRYQFFESRGWTRKDIDNYYYTLRKLTRGTSTGLATDYVLIRAIGWIPYNWRKFKDWKKERSKQDEA